MHENTTLIKSPDQQSEVPRVSTRTEETGGTESETKRNIHGKTSKLING